MRRSCLRLRPFPGGGLYFRSGLTRAERDQVSVATLVMCDRLVAKRSEIYVRLSESKGAGTQKSVGS